MVRAKVMVTFAALTALLLAGRICAAAVVVFDRVTLVDQPVQLAVRTKGRLFPRGGELVELYAGDTFLKRVLTGGDGYGYLTYTPQEAGLHDVGAVYENTRESGLLLVMSPGQQAILVDVETALRESLFAAGARDGSRRALEALNRVYQVIYIYGITGLTLTRQWLRANELPPSAALPWQDGNLANRLQRRGIRLFALIGSPAQISAAGKSIEHRFSFEKTDDGRRIDGWTDLFRALDLKSPFDSD